MTSLRTFQTEIEEIHHRELIKQRAQTIAILGKEKENKNPQAQGKAKGNSSDPDEGDGNVNVAARMVEVEEKIMVLPQLLQDSSIGLIVLARHRYFQTQSLSTT